MNIVLSCFVLGSSFQNQIVSRAFGGVFSARMTFGLPSRWERSIISINYYLSSARALLYVIIVVSCNLNALGDILGSDLLVQPCTANAKIMIGVIPSLRQIPPHWRSETPSAVGNHLRASTGTSTNDCTIHLPE